MLSAVLIVTFRRHVLNSHTTLVALNLLNRDNIANHTLTILQSLIYCI